MTHAGLASDPALLAQPRAAHTLERLIAEGRAHALLLSGAAGSGPLAAAARVGQRVLCPNGGDDGCDVCARVARHVHPDLHWIAPEGGTLAIDQMRRVVDVVSRMPFEASAQVVVIEAADTLSSDNAAAGNSLLKALEEPAGRVIFVLVAERAARVLPTIRSRSIEVAFPPIADALLVEALRADGLDEARAAAATGLDLHGIARAARGDLERARSIAAGDAAAQRRGDLFTTMYAVATKSAPPSQLANRIIARAAAANDATAAAATTEFEALADGMGAAERRSFLAKSNDDGMEKRVNRRARKARGAELRACFDDLASWWRDVLVVHAGSPEAAANLDRLEQVGTVAQGPGGGHAVAALDAIDEAAARIAINNADEPVTVGALTSELAAIAGGRVSPRRAMGALARTTAGYDLTLA